MEEKQFTVMRAWEAGHDKIRYAYRDEETGRVKIGETKFYNWFYVRSFDLEANAVIFKKFLSDGSLVKIKKEGLYARCYYSTVHESEFLDSNNDKVWTFKNWKVNKMLESLSMLEIQTYEADVPMVKRWLLQENVKICDDYKVLYYDIETDDRWADGLKNLGGHRILSVAMKSSDSKNTDGKMFFLHLKEDSDEAEEEFLRKVARVFDAHDCIIAFNGSNFDDVYVKSRFARYGIEIDWRKKFLQDALWTFKKYGPQMQSYSLDKIAKSILDRGKVEHEGMRIYDMWKNDPALLKKYNIEDVQLMYEIECKTGYLNAHRGICAFGMCFVDDLFVLHKIDNFVLKQAQEDKLYHFKTVVRNYDAEEEKDDGATYAGAFVFDPIAGLHKHVKVLDFSSLYPNTINTFNISPDTFIEDKDLDKYDMKDVITTPTGHHYRKDFVGIIPKVIMSLKSKREYWKEKMSHETYGSVMHKVYDRMQYLYKYFGLSFYGCMGEKHSRFYDTRIAESVTLTGQHFTKTCAAFVKDKYGAKIVYGDTDSFFFTHDEICKDHERILRLSDELSKVCYEESVVKRNCNVCTLKMSYDKSFTKYLILNGKKRYAGVIDYLDGHEYTEFKMYVAGFEYKRTDSCLYVKNKQYELLKMILTETPDYEFIRKYVLDMKNEVCGGKLPLSDIIFAQKITKELDSYGKQMHARVAREMEQDGKSVYIGDKIEYYVSHLDENGDPVVKPSYKFNGQYARTYYWNNKIFPAIQRILEVVYDKIDWNNYLVSNKKVTTHSRSLW